MKRKIETILIVMLFCSLLIPFTALAGDEQNPEIKDSSDGNLTVQ
jgi:hypothetical protein